MLDLEEKYNKMRRGAGSMGQVISIETRRRYPAHHRQRGNEREQLPLMLAQLLAAGATDFTRVALDAWGKHELEPEEIMDLCITYADVTGLETLA